MSNRQTYTTMWCQRCGEAVDKVDPSAHGVICYMCVYKKCMSLWNPLDVPVRKASGKPPGWHWRKVFVAKDGTVYHKGKEQPKLKGTLKPTKFKPPKKREKSPAQILLVEDGKFKIFYVPSRLHFSLFHLHLHFL